jgi:hypothetical protein
MYPNWKFWVKNIPPGTTELQGDFKNTLVTVGSHLMGPRIGRVRGQRFKLFGISALKRNHFMT